MRARRLYFFAALAVVTTFAACTLNPQPLPPLDPEATNGPGGGFGTTSDAAAAADGGARQDDESPYADAAVGQDGSWTPEPDADAGDAGDAGLDAGDAGDAGDVTVD